MNEPNTRTMEVRNSQARVADLGLLLLLLVYRGNFHASEEFTQHETVLYANKDISSLDMLRDTPQAYRASQKPWFIYNRYYFI